MLSNNMVDVTFQIADVVNLTNSHNLEARSEL